MMKHLVVCLFAAICCLLPTHAQDVGMTWHTPSSEGLDFYTNSSEIVVRFIYDSPVSGIPVNLYGADKDGVIHDYEPVMEYGDTTVCRFGQMEYANARVDRGYNFHLTWTEECCSVQIGILSDAVFGVDPVIERPIVFLQSEGSSAQTDFTQSLPYALRRQTGHEVVTVKLSARGRLSDADVLRIKRLQPQLVITDDKRAKRYGKANHAAFLLLQGDVAKQAEYVRAQLGEDSEKRCAFRPVTQQRDPYDWQLRHRNVLKVNAEEPPAVVLIGNSITHYWAGLPTGRLIRGTDSWEDLWQGTIAHNLGFGWDRIENVLWRINHGELDGYAAEKVLLLLGTNNIAYNTDEEIAEGIVEVVRRVRSHQPKAQIYVCSILPRLDHGDRVEPANAAIQRALLHHHSPAQFLDLTPMAFDADGNFRKELFSDGLHPNAEGYRVLAARLKLLLAGENR